MRYLALTAMALMLCMPALSRWQQIEVPSEAQEGRGDLEMCLSEASRAALGVDGHAQQHLPEDNAPAHDHHLDHDACGYCVLATRMLPVLALVLALPAPLRTRHLPQASRPAPPISFKWPAHSPRGPPVRF